MTLREALVVFSQGWKDDLSASWQAALADVDPDANAVEPSLQFSPEKPIFPGRKGRILVGAPSHSHVFRALDGIGPSDVRAVVIGQDPYPNIEWATGRSFEQGNLVTWPTAPKLLSDSLERIIPSAMEARTGNNAYTQATSEGSVWPKIVTDLSAGTLDLQPPMTLFDDWQSQGVMFLNAGLTLTHFKRGGSPEQLQGHIPFWRSVVREILRTVVTRPTGQVVFLLWGKVARDMVNAAGIEQAAKDAGTWQTRVRFVTHDHPAAALAGLPLFFKPPNPFSTANQALEQMGAEPIHW